MRRVPALILAIAICATGAAAAEPAPGGPAPAPPLPTSGPKPDALYGSGTCQLAKGGGPLGYVGCSESQFFTNARGRIRDFAAPYDHGKRYQCTAQLYNQAKTYPVARNGAFHFTAVIAQGSHGSRGTLRVSGRFTSPTAAHGSYRYDLGAGCRDKRRMFRVRFIGTPAA